MWEAASSGSPPRLPSLTIGTLIFGEGGAEGWWWAQTVSNGLGGGAAGVPPPGRGADGVPDAVPERSSGSARRNSARRTAAETYLRPVACGGTLAWARAARGLRVKREPRRVRVAERGPGVRGKPSRQGGRGCGG